MKQNSSNDPDAFLQMALKRRQWQSVQEPEISGISPEFKKQKAKPWHKLKRKQLKLSKLFLPFWHSQNANS